ncbi:hypothetical protein [Burkholderia phage FLC9]|nr:hypothetical protein [Burkholderia phage FLC9]
MIILSGSPKPILRASVQAQHYPTLLVLDTDAGLRELIKGAGEFDFLMPNTIAQIVLDSIMYEQHARMELQYAALELIRNELGDAHETAYIKLARLIHSFGEDVLQKLKYLRAYQNGYLYYQFHDWYGNDLVLQRLIVDNINPNL